MTKQREYPTWICHNCGVKYCHGFADGGRSATYHIDNCDCCGAEDVPCTEPRDYGHFKEWPLPREIDPKPLPQTLEDLIEPCLQYFDFERVHKAMALLKWWWLTGDGPDRVPTAEHIKESARKLLQKVCEAEKKEDETIVIGSGGLLAKRYSDGICLQFVLAESDVYLDDFQ